MLYECILPINTTDSKGVTKMSESPQKGHSSESSNENEQWLRQTFADVFKNLKPIQEKELRIKYKNARKFSIDQYMPHYITGNYANSEFLITPLIDHLNAGIFTQLDIDGYCLPFMLKGSLLISENPEKLNKCQRDYSTLFLQYLSATEEPFVATKSDITYLGIHKTIIEGGYLFINKLWPAEYAEEALQKGFIHPAHNEYFYINDLKGNKVPFIKETKPAILPLMLNNIELVNSNGDIIFT